MPPKITRVRWSAENIPWGLVFDENTGVFSGKPDDIGEYTVPVTVETNYGKDTQDVKFVVEPATPTYGVYIATGRRAWVVQNSEPNTNGFYPVRNIPKVTALSDYPYGFRAYTNSGDIYGCGLAGVQRNNINSSYDTWDVTTLVDEISSPKNIKCVGFKQHRNSYPNAHRLASCAMLTKDDKMTVKHIVFHEVTVSGNSFKTTKTFEEIGGVSVNNISVLDIGTYDGGIRWLSEDGTQDCYIQYSGNDCWYSTTAELTLKDLGYRAVKLISPAPFNFLSEDNFLDNNPNNFTHGVIKDVWGYGTLMYVQTIENQLYEYVPDNHTWCLLGTYDVKKIEVPNDKYMFMLTNDGSLYHKGNAVSSRNDISWTSQVIAKRNEILTHIFPSEHFIDFTFSHGIGLINGIDSTLNDYNYLVVLKE